MSGPLLRSALVISPNQIFALLCASLCEVERSLRELRIKRLHCSLEHADGYAVRLTAERVALPIVYGQGADLGEAFADLLRKAEADMGEAS